MEVEIGILGIVRFQYSGDISWLEKDNPHAKNVRRDGDTVIFEYWNDTGDNKHRTDWGRFIFMDYDRKFFKEFRENIPVDEVVLEEIEWHSARISTKALQVTEFIECKK